MRIDVFHDTVCPWCRIGKRHLSLALEQWPGDVDIYYRSFFLNPDIPAEGANFREYMHAKGGGRIPLEQFFAGPRDAGERVGLTFNFEAIVDAPNSTLSHELIALTPETAREAMIDAIYAAYFEHAQNIGDIDVLLNIAESHSLERATIQQRLNNGEARDTVLQDVGFARQAGISGVPMFVFDNMYALSGAQPPRVLLQAMQQVKELASQ